MSASETDHGIAKKSYFLQKDERYPISNKSLPELFEEAANREDQNYVTWHRPAERYTYRELYQRAQKVAKGLIAAGLKRGDCVMGIGCQGSDGVVMFMATASIGLVFSCPYLYTPTNKTLPAAIERLQPKLILAGDTFDAGGLYARTFMTLCDWIKEQSDDGKSTPLVYFDSISAKSDECMKYNLFAKPLTSLIDQGTSISDSNLRKEISATGINEPTLYALTSGSTGVPKIIVIGANYYINSNWREDRLQLTKDNIVYGFTNMAVDDTFLACEFTAAVKIGYPCVIFPSPNKHTEEEVIQEICECIQQHRVAFINIDQCYGRSIALNPLMREKYDLSSVRGWMLCAAPVSRSQKEQILVDYPMTVDTYGMMEVYVVTCPDLNINKQKPSTCGRPPINVEVKVCGDDGNMVDCGKEGELLVKTPTMFLCYKDQPELTKSIFTEDGWFKTGDCVKMDEDGDIFYVSRMSKTERYKVWADIVYAVPIEHILNRHPKIKECCVIGIPSADISAGQEICYCVVPSVTDLTMEEIRIYASENMRDQREWPTRLMFMDKLPRHGARRKVNKLKLIERFEKEVNEDNSLYKVKYNVGQTAQFK